MAESEKVLDNSQQGEDSQGKLSEPKIEMFLREGEPAIVVDFVNVQTQQGLVYMTFFHVDPNSVEAVIRNKEEPLKAYMQTRLACTPLALESFIDTMKRHLSKMQAAGPIEAKGSTHAG